MGKMNKLESKWRNFILFFIILLCYQLHQSQSSISRYFFTQKTKIISKYPYQANITSHTKYFYKCENMGEAFSGSIFVTKAHLIQQVKNYQTPKNITRVNVELGSFMMMNRNTNRSSHKPGSVLQSRDVLDFSVIHLSSFERAYRFDEHEAFYTPNPNMKAVKEAHQVTAKLARRRHQIGALFTQQQQQQQQQGRSDLPHSLSKRTLVVMPYLERERGLGGSHVTNRFLYLSSCFWSFYLHFPNIAAGVMNQQDLLSLRRGSGLPFYDVILLDEYSSPNALPYMLVKETALLLESGEWDFDYVFYTESDQILMMRIPDQIFEYFKAYPKHVLSPHRLMAYPKVILKNVHKREVSKVEPLDWYGMKCEMPLQFCPNDRSTWIHLSNRAVPVLNIYGLQVPLGNCEYFHQRYRPCQLT